MEIAKALAAGRSRPRERLARVAERIVRRGGWAWLLKKRRWRWKTVGGRMASDSSVEVSLGIII